MITYEEMTPHLILKYFPELKTKAEEEIAFWKPENIPAHCLFGNVFNSYLTALLHEYRDLEMICRIFDFYEYLAGEGDEKVKNLLQVTLLEYLWDCAHIYHRAVFHMGENTRKINADIASYLTMPLK